MRRALGWLATIAVLGFGIALLRAGAEPPQFLQQGGWGITALLALAILLGGRILTPRQCMACVHAAALAVIVQVGVLGATQAFAGSLFTDHALPVLAGAITAGALIGTLFLRLDRVRWVFLPAALAAAGLHLAAMFALAGMQYGSAPTLLDTETLLAPGAAAAWLVFAAAKAGCLALWNKRTAADRD